MVVLALVRYRCRRPAPAALAGALVPGVSWLVVARLAGADSEYLTNSKTSQLLRLDTGVLHRIPPAMESVWHEMSTIVIVAGAVSVVGMLVAARGRRRLSTTAWPWMWLAWLATTWSVVYAYVVSPAALVWHLGTSVDRTTIAPRLLLSAETVVWAGAAVAALRQDDARPAPTVTAWSARASSSLSPELSP